MWETNANWELCVIMNAANNNKKVKFVLKNIQLYEMVSCFVCVDFKNYLSFVIKLFASISAR